MIWTRDYLRVTSTIVDLTQNVLLVLNISTTLLPYQKVHAGPHLCHLFHSKTLTFGPKSTSTLLLTVTFWDSLFRSLYTRSYRTSKTSGPTLDICEISFYSFKNESL